MSTVTGTDEAAGYPDFPGTRDARCPFDPPAAYADWRRGQGLQRVRMLNGRAAWAVTRYDDVKEGLSDPRVSADGRRFPELVSSDEKERPAAFPRMDDPGHARIRRMLTGEFTVKRVEAMRPKIRDLVDSVLDDMIAKGERPTDLVSAYALPIPSLVISLLLGVPYEDHAFFQKHSAIINHSEASPQEMQTASGALFGYLADLVRRKEDEPGDDLVTRLLNDRVATGQLSPRELAMNAMILLHAGHDTTANVIALGTFALLSHPEQAAKLRDADDPKMIERAVEELLRYLTISQDMLVRIATEDLTIGGQLVRAGETLTFSLPSANRDTIFPAAGVLDFDRDTRGHVVFGYGVHGCLGQNLARVELQEALPALLRRLPGLRLAVAPQEVELRHTMATFGVHALPVTW